MRRKYSKEVVNSVLQDIKCGTKIDQASEKYQIPCQTISNWISRHCKDGIEVVARNKILEKENSNLKELIILKELEIQRLKQIILGK